VGAARTFDLVATGPYPRTCTCAAKGKGSGARYNASSSYLCFDEGTDTAESGAIGRRKITGQTFNLIANVRSRFTCKVDPSCVVEAP
jgi:hypothetical protein